MTRILLFLLGTVFGQGVFAQYLKYSNEFLSLGVGGRAMAMGGAVTASVDDATAVYWNPAGLLQVKDKYQLALMHNEQFAGIARHDYATWVYREDEHKVFALSMFRLGIDDIPNTLNMFVNGQIDYSRIPTFSAVDYAFMVSYAKSMANLRVGGNVKVIRRVIGSFADAWGFGFDLGVQGNWNKVKWGVAFRDVTTTFNAWSFHFTDAEKQILQQTGNRIPTASLELTAPRAIFGISRQWELFDKRFTIYPGFDLDATFDGQRNVLISNPYLNIDPRAGLEMGYRGIVFLRGGVNNFQQVKDIDGGTSLSFVPSLGAGIHLRGFTLDYALANPGGSNLPHSNIISLKLEINP